MATIALIRAASDGDAQAVKALLAEGKDVNVSTPGGQTPLMLAALFGHADVVRLLLEAGADTQLKDSLGLSAMEWSERRGFSKIAKLLASPSPRGSVPPRANAVEVHTHPGGEQERQQSTVEAKTTTEKQVRTWMEMLERVKAGPESSKAAEALPTAEAPPTAEEMPTPQTPPTETLPGAEELPTAEDWARVRASMESSPVEAEARKQDETEALTKSLPEMRDTEPEEPSHWLGSPAAALEPRTTESFDLSHIKLCPKCNTIYRSELLAYCSYDATPLISADAPPLNYAATPALERQTLWVLVTITLVGSALIAYLINSYLYTERSNSSIATQTEEAANAKKDLPSISGALAGKEINLPNPEYPANLKSEGISGTVTVMVRVNRKGIVISVRALNGNPLLQAVALEAAKKATFSPEKLAGYTGVVSGTITYTFKL